MAIQSRSNGRPASAALAWAEEGRDEPLARGALTLYQRYPRLSPYGVLRSLRAALGPELITGARRQQGMLHIFHGYCCRGGCAGLSGEQAGCPLA